MILLQLSGCLWFVISNCSIDDITGLMQCDSNTWMAKRLLEELAEEGVEQLMEEYVEDPENTKLTKLMSVVNDMFYKNSTQDNHHDDDQDDDHNGDHDESHGGMTKMMAYTDSIYWALNTMTSTGYVQFSLLLETLIEISVYDHLYKRFFLKLRGFKVLSLSLCLFYQYFHSTSINYRKICDEKCF